MTPSAATRILSEEHRLIERGLDCLAALVGESRRQGRLDREAAAEALALIRDFADRCHHAKEEDRLFLAMESAGMPRAGGPIAVMLDEHERGREHVRAMTEASAAAASGDPAALARFAAHAGDLDRLLREHIAKEDQILFRMADELLEPGAVEALLGEFRSVEAEAGGRRHREWLERVSALCQRCALEPPEPTLIPTLSREFL